MAAEKENTKAKKASSHKKQQADKLQTQHPFETDSQIENRYGKGREKNGSDGTHQDRRGSNH